jgi:anaphase-promoting complex subunit 3
LLAQAYCGEQKLSKAYEVLIHCKSPLNRYKLAQISIRINDINMAERALLNMVGENRDRAKTYKNSMEQIPNGAAGLYLLGMIYERKAQTQQAEECYELALKEDPTLWTAYEKLVTFKAKQPL